MVDEELLGTILREVHRYIEDAAAAVVAKIERAPSNEPRAALAYPPTDAARLTSDERDALGRLQMTPELRAALMKIVRDGVSDPFFRFFSLLDGVSDSKTATDGTWYGADLVVHGEEDREMMHDAFFESFHDYDGARKGSDK